MGFYQKKMLSSGYDCYIAMATPWPIDLKMVYRTKKKWVDFPWRTVSHNQRVNMLMIL